jgi:hypothetical protein
MSQHISLVLRSPLQVDTACLEFAFSLLTIRFALASNLDQ